jgi:hypothetical protein
VQQRLQQLMGFEASGSVQKTVSFP